ncbi:hypothetical protein FSP39_018182 [Pinctada imbricata]|uniref:C-type lectin domain-containing protein n=1 Tax=Pinctada imbricata TaxID=66713 RepID=A0AA88YIZ9_PINIB|nr:hypothetical protein FSP39_018182 [Pinctada imbricata]
MAWIGGSDFDIEGTWKWTNSNTIFWSSNNVPPGAYYTWYPNQPDNAWNNEDCLEIFGGKWNDRSCTDKRRGICEKNL